VDKTTRKYIQDATQGGRALLERSYREQLEGTYDILLDGTISEQAGSHLSDHQKVVREMLVATMAHKRSTGMSPQAAVQAYLREAAFTTLNRFVALKMLEARDLLQECISKGEDSSGFKEFTALAPGLVAVEDKGYRLYIETLFDEIGQEVRVLFDRRDVASLLWPDRQTLLELVSILNAPELSNVWAEDETIGWVYQFFNSDDDRQKARYDNKGKPKAPQNSHELAVRNQFFTPRYVVQFLTDNTLGRTWYEMMQGDTKLARLDYLARRPNEIFLAEGESAPESEADDSELSQEELLQQTVYVPFRAKKDPRDLRILDPACGSGHFLLYAFELLVSIYDEAWSDAGAAAFTETGTHLRADYGNLDALRRAMPELILRHNLHGVDIDPRAAQIAALALWMRAQRAYNQFEVDRAERPPIIKTNIVVAEPMPGDAELVDEFAASLKPAVLGDLFKKMVEEMKLAGELGSLLKIEGSIAKAVKDAEEAHHQEGLFAEKIESQDFWDTADEKIIAALASFAESAAGSAGIRRQLFAGDAAQGVAFIELMRKRFDVTLMNPPFGAGSLRAKTVFEKSYPRTKNDIYAAFVERGVMGLHPQARLGAITSRTGFFLKSFQRWREEILLHEAPPVVVADLGYGVMDDAMVEAAAYCLEAIS
jgi:Eco57I restriction-modification methylase